ncbi:MAG: hypothetical protein IPJ88_05375 [Myxococcales bacterium]|nr:MAG: hypothetical protein IPJ88_05375 [Myxococcales bacterium]
MLKPNCTFLLPLVSVVFFFNIGACSKNAIDLLGKACPCVAGFVCDDTRQVCVDAASQEDGGPDNNGSVNSSSDGSSPLPLTLSVEHDAEAFEQCKIVEYDDTNGYPSKVVTQPLGYDACTNNIYPNASLCNTFEEGSIDSPWILPLSTGGFGPRISIGTIVPYRGTYSLRTLNNDSSVEMIARYETTVFDAAPERLNFRFYFYSYAATAQGSYHFARLSWMTSSISLGADEQHVPVLRVGQDGEYVDARVDELGLTLASTDSSDAIELDINPSDKTIIFWLNGVCADAFRYELLSEPKDISLELGLFEPRNLDPGQAQIVYFDDIVMQDGLVGEIKKPVIGPQSSSP